MNLTFGFHRSSHVSPDCLKLFAPLPRRVNESPSNWQGLFCSVSGQWPDTGEFTLTTTKRSFGNNYQTTPSAPATDHVYGPSFSTFFREFPKMQSKK